MRGRSFFGAVALSTLASACSGTSFIEGSLTLEGIADGGEYAFAEVRAFPPHADGFSVRRVYEGGELLEQSILLGELQVPITFRAEGYDVGDPGGPWRILAWLTDRESSTWVGTNEPFGTREFLFDCENGPVCAIRGVELEVDQVAPSN